MKLFKIFAIVAYLFIILMGSMIGMPLFLAAAVGITAKYNALLPLLCRRPT